MTTIGQDVTKKKSKNSRVFLGEFLGGVNNSSVFVGDNSSGVNISIESHGGGGF